MMIAANDPFIGINRTGNFRNDVIDRGHIPIRNHFQMYSSGAGANVIADAKSAAPRLRGDGTFERSEKRFRVAVRNREDGNLGDRLGVFYGEALGVFRRANAWSERVAGVERHVRDAAALHSIYRAIGSLGENFALRVSVFVWIGKNQAANGAMFRSNFRLNATPRAVVARDNDGALDGDAHALELLVVRGHTKIDVDQRSGHVSVYRVRVVGRKLFGRLVRSGIFFYDGLLQLCGEYWLAIRIHQFDGTLFRRGHKHVERFDMRIETEFLVLRQQPIGVFFIVRRTNVMRPRGKVFHVASDFIRIRNGFHFFFPLAFSA